MASLATAALLTSAVGSIINGGAKVAQAGVSGATTVASAGAAGAAGSAGSQSDSNAGPTGYFLDSLFRKTAPTPAPSASDASGVSDANAKTPSTVDAGATSSAPIGEVSRIFMNSIRSGALSPDDTHYVGQLVAQRTGLSQQDAEKRVTATYTRLQSALNNAEAQAKDAANKARKAAAYAALWIFVSLLIGAFIASLAATFGGRRRDL